MKVLLINKSGRAIWCGPTTNKGGVLLNFGITGLYLSYEKNGGFRFLPDGQHYLVWTDKDCLYFPEN